MAASLDDGRRVPAEPAGTALAEALNLPLLQRRIFAPYKIATLIDTVTEPGLSAETVLAGTDLDAARVHDPHVLTSIQDYLTACENVVAAGAEMTVAYDIGSRLHLSAYGMYGYALICSPSVRDFFDFAVRYHLLATPMIRLGWRQEGDLAVWEFNEIYRDAMSRGVRDFLTRQQMMMTATHMRDIAGPDILPRLARFGLPDSGIAAEDEIRLGCPCRFDADAHELHYPAAILDKAPQFANRLTHLWLEETCDALIGEAKLKSGLSGEIYQMLMVSPTRMATMEAVAAKMGITERTLRRRLDAEGARYADIVDDVRKRIALQYVRTTTMNADDIALMVGFSDTANLRRALKRWTGRTWGELRNG